MLYSHMPSQHLKTEQDIVSGEHTTQTMYTRSFGPTFQAVTSTSQERTEEHAYTGPDYSKDEGQDMSEKQYFTDLPGSSVWKSESMESLPAVNPHISLLGQQNDYYEHLLQLVSGML